MATVRSGDSPAFHTYHTTCHRPPHLCDSLFVFLTHWPLGCLLDYSEVLRALSNHSWMRFYDGWLGVTLDNPDQHTGAQLLPSLMEETRLGLPVLVHADPRVYPRHRQSDGHLMARPRGQSLHGPRPPDKACDNPMVGKGVVSDDLLKVQLAAFLLAQGNYTYFAFSEGWTDEQQPPVDKSRPLHQWRWYPQFNEVYGKPLGPAIRGADRVYRRDFERCSVSLAVNGSSATNASIIMKREMLDHQISSE